MCVFLKYLFVSALGSYGTGHLNNLLLLSCLLTVYSKAVLYRMLSRFFKASSGIFLGVFFLASGSDLRPLGLGVGIMSSSSRPSF